MVNLCKCGCGKPAKINNKYINGHNGKGISCNIGNNYRLGSKHTEKAKEKNRASHLGKKHTEASIKKMSDIIAAATAEKVGIRFILVKCFSQ